MPHDELKPKDRVVLRMTRDGAVEENLTEGTSEKVSKRLEDAQLVAPHDTETGDIAEEVKKRRQLRPDELEDAESQAQAETQSADAAQEYKPGDLPVSDDPTSHTLHAETYRTHSVDYGKAFASYFPKSQNCSHMTSTNSVLVFKSSFDRSTARLSVISLEARSTM